MKTAVRIMLLFLAVAWSAMAVGQESDNGVDSDAFVPTLTVQEIAQIQQNPTQFIERTIQMLFELSPDGVVTDDILDRREEMQFATARMSLTGRILVYDLDGDFYITKEEIEFQFPVLSTQQRGQIESLLVLADMNRDGDLSTRELSAHVNNVSENAPRRPRSYLQKYAILMSLDENADGQITADEIGVVIMRVAQGGEVNVFQPSSRMPFRPRKSIPTDTVTPKR